MAGDEDTCPSCPTAWGNLRFCRWALAADCRPPVCVQSEEALRDVTLERYCYNVNSRVDPASFASGLFLRARKWGDERLSKSPCFQCLFGSFRGVCLQKASLKLFHEKRPFSVYYIICKISVSTCLKSTKPLLYIIIYRVKSSQFSFI